MTPQATFAPVSFGVLDRTRLAHDRDLDLPGVLQLLLDLFGDVPRHHLGGEVVDVLGLDHHADLATGLHRVDLLDARVARADLLEALEALDVGLQALAAGPRAAARDSVGDLRDHRVDRPLLDLAVVGLDAVDDLGRFLHPPGDLGADDRMRALDLVRYRLADVVEQRTALGDRRVDPELGRDRRGDVRRLDEVLEDVLPVRGPELQAPEQPDHLGVHVGDHGVEHRLLARALDLLVDLPLRALER